jgi:probable rRNA maturation factor
LSIVFYSNVTGFRNKLKNKLIKCISILSIIEEKNIENIYVNVVNDASLLKMNTKYLNHNYLTDIITFDYSEKTKISGELFISIDRVRDNAHAFETKSENEFARVVIHGVLHLFGYKDKTKREKHQMRKKEDYYLSILNSFT